MFVAELTSILTPNALESVMGSTTDSQFRHRLYNDGSFESVCTHCYTAIAKARREADLRLLELAHVCDAWTRAYVCRKAIPNYFGP